MGSSLKIGLANLAQGIANAGSGYLVGQQQADQELERRRQEAQALADRQWQMQNEQVGQQRSLLGSLLPRVAPDQQGDVLQALLGMNAGPPPGAVPGRLLGGRHWNPMQALAGGGAGAPAMPAGLRFVDPEAGGAYDEPLANLERALGSSAYSDAEKAALEQSRQGVLAAKRAGTPIGQYPGKLYAAAPAVNPNVAKGIATNLSTTLRSIEGAVGNLPAGSQARLLADEALKSGKLLGADLSTPEQIDAARDWIRTYGGLAAQFVSLGQQGMQAKTLADDIKGRDDTFGQFFAPKGEQQPSGAALLAAGPQLLEMERAVAERAKKEGKPFLRRITGTPFEPELRAILEKTPTDPEGAAQEMEDFRDRMSTPKPLTGAQRDAAFGRMASILGGFAPERVTPDVIRTVARNVGLGYAADDVADLPFGSAAGQKRFDTLLKGMEGAAKLDESGRQLYIQALTGAARASGAKFDVPADIVLNASEQEKQKLGMMREQLALRGSKLDLSAAKLSLDRAKLALDRAQAQKNGGVTPTAAFTAQSARLAAIARAKDAAYTKQVDGLKRQQAAANKAVESNPKLPGSPYHWEDFDPQRALQDAKIDPAALKFDGTANLPLKALDAIKDPTQRNTVRIWLEAQEATRRALAAAKPAAADTVKPKAPGTAGAGRPSAGAPETRTIHLSDGRVIRADYQTLYNLALKRAGNDANAAAAQANKFWRAGTP